MTADHWQQVSQDLGPAERADQACPRAALLDAARLDEARLDALLDMAGPEEARALMRQVQIDLGRVGAGITASLKGQDAGALRRHSHDLMAIAGTIGAPGVHQQASALNHIARTGLGADRADWAAAAAVAAQTGLLLDQLVAQLAAMATRLGYDSPAVHSPADLNPANLSPAPHSTTRHNPGAGG